MTNMTHIARHTFRVHELGIRIMRMRRQDPAPEHSHDFHELVVVLDGEGTHVTEVGNYPICGGDVFVIKPGQVHAYRDTQDMSLVNILYIPEILTIPTADLVRLPGYHALFELEPRVRDQHGFQSRLHLKPTELQRAQKLIDQIEEETRLAGQGGHFMAMANFMLLQGFLSRCYTGTFSTQTRMLYRLGELMGFIEDNYDRQLSLDELSQKANMSRSTLNRNFHASLGLSPINYLIARRVERAAGLLQNTDLSVTDIAFRVGFTDSNYFTRQFKRLMKLTPLRYRRVRRHEQESFLNHFQAQASIIRKETL